MKKIAQISLLAILIIMFSGYSFSQGIIIPSGARVIKTGGYTIIKSGNWTNNGTFTHTGGTLVFSGTTQTLGGGSTATYYDITIATGSSTSITTTTGQRLSGILLCNGTLTTNGKLTLASTAAGTALINGAGSGTVSGNVTMERYLPSGFGYKYISSPFQGSTASQFDDDVDLDIPANAFYKYDENRLVSGLPASGWVNYKNTDFTNVLEPLAGYALNCGATSSPNTIDVTGVVNNVPLSVTLYNHSQPYTQGYNLVGNPYPSPIDWNATSGWTRTNLDLTLYYFKASAGNRNTGTYSTYLNPVSSDGLASNIIPSMQAFFVHVTPASATFGMNNSVRVTNRTGTFMKGEPSINPLIRLAATFTDNPASPDPCVIYFNEKADNEFDPQLDALKLYNTDLNVPNLYSIDPGGEKLSINALPYTEEADLIVPLGLKVSKDGFVSFRIRDIAGTFSQMRLYLSDLVAGTMQDLLPDKEYKVFLIKGEYLNRFYLNCYNSTTNLPESIPTVNDLFSIYSSDGLLKAEINKLQNNEGTLMISNMLGQILFTGKVHETGYHEFSPSIKDGIYIATLISGNTRVSKKLFVKN